MCGWPCRTRAHERFKEHHRCFEQCSLSPHTRFICRTQHLDACGSAPRLGATFGDQRVSARAGDGAVNLADQLHVVEQGVEGVEVGEAHHVGGAASCGLREAPKKDDSVCEL